ncbi:unnamed protein product [Heterobilharzia americana]|nr:unnamed protein product [Heterobilharzia americana]
MKQRLSTGSHGSSVSDIDREAFILANLQHENIVNLHEVFYREDSVVLILDLVTGGELFARVADCERLSEEEASNFVQQILLGVQHMHGLGIVHLDLKPENIMIEDLESRKIKIIDFGLARVLNPNESFQDMAGTPEFCAPEIVNFDPITFATDMWAVGVLTYILLTGISPFAGDTQLETFQNILDCIVDYSREEIENVSDLAKDFIQRLLIKNPRKRATVNECLQHPWIKPKDNKQSTCRRDSLISKEKLSSLRHFIATNPSANVLSMNSNNNADQENKPPSSPTSPVFPVKVNEKPRFSLPDNSVNSNKVVKTSSEINSIGQSSSNRTVENRQLYIKESGQNKNNNNNNTERTSVQTDKVKTANHVIQAKHLSNYKVAGNVYSANSKPPPIVSHVINSQTSEKQNNNYVSRADPLIPLNSAKKLSPRNSISDSVPSASSVVCSDKNVSTITSSNSSGLPADKTSSDSLSNKSVTNNSTGNWRTTFQNNIIGRLGAAFAAATGHVTTSATTTHHTLVNVTNSKLSNTSNNDKLLQSTCKTNNANTLHYLPTYVTDLKSEIQIHDKTDLDQSVNKTVNEAEVDSSPDPRTSISSTSTIKTISTNQKLGFVQLASKEIGSKVNQSKTSTKNINSSISSFGVVSRAVKEMEITSGPLNNSSLITCNNDIVESKIVRRFQSLGMNQLTEATYINRSLPNGYPNEKTNANRGPLCNPSNRVMVSKLQEMFESGNTKEAGGNRISRTTKSSVPNNNNNNNNNNSNNRNLPVN